MKVLRDGKVVRIKSDADPALLTALTPTGHRELHAIAPSDAQPTRPGGKRPRADTNGDEAPSDEGPVPSDEELPMRQPVGSTTEALIAEGIPAKVGKARRRDRR